VFLKVSRTTFLSLEVARLPQEPGERVGKPVEKIITTASTAQQNTTTARENSPFGLAQPRTQKGRLIGGASETGSAIDVTAATAVSCNITHAATANKQTLLQWQR